MPPARRPHVAVVGAGAAGLYTALCAARHGARVTLVSATPLAGASSYWAQGGLAAALAEHDTPDLHLEDTLRAGRGAVRESAARVLVDEAPGQVAELTALGVHFDSDPDGHLALGLEGGHSQRRIVHAGGAATGRRLIRQLSAVAAQDPRIAVIEGRRVTRVLTEPSTGAALGLQLDDATTLSAGAVVIATGGAAALWARTTNPLGAAGTGLMLAHAAGATLADLELVQFHPTAVASADEADGFLVSEAVRGEGALLINAAGERFVDELAPRDEVARAVARQLADGPVGLDMRDVDPALFPNIVGALRRVGIDPESQLVPVAHAAHYVMGGIAVDLHGQSSVPGLFAVGEASCTGLHGANRLASNSLSECFVFGARAARAAAGRPPVPDDPPPAPAQPPPDLTATDASREALWRDAGIERDADGLTRLSDDPHPLVRLIARAALARAESRGAHRRVDHPELDPAMTGRHIVLRDDTTDRETWS